MNKRLFVVGGAMLCAVITYASVLAVKNRAARKSATPNAASQPLKLPKNGEVRKVSTEPASGNPIMQEAVGPVANNVPEHVVYSFLFRHQNFMKKKAEEAERLGQDSSFFRNYYQREARLDDRQAAMLSEIATQFELDVKAIEAEAKIVVDKVRAQRASAPVKPDEPLPPPSPELIALQKRRNSLVIQARNQLERAMGPSSFNEFQKFVREKVSSQIKPKSPDTLRAVGGDSAERQPRGKPPQQ